MTKWLAVLVLSIYCNCISAKQLKEEMLVDYVVPKLAALESRWFYVAPVSANDGLISAGPVDSGLGGYKGGGNIVGNEGKGHQGFVLAKGFQLGALLLKPSCTYDNIKNDEIIGDDIQKPGYFQIKYKSDSGEVEYKATTSSRNAKISVNYKCREGNYLHIVYGESLGESGEIGVSETIGFAKSKNNILYGYTRFKPPYATINNRINFYISAAGSCGKHSDDGKVFIFKCSKNAVELDAALSFVDWQGAKKNYELEGRGRSFEMVYLNVKNEWENLLSRVRIEGDEDQKKLFYTYLWNSLRGKSIINDADGRVYLNGKIHLINKKIYNTDSMWGAGYNLIPLWALVYPEKLKAYVDGLLELNDIYGLMPDGWMGAGPVQGMSTNTSATIVAAAVNYNILSLTPRVYEAILKVSGIVPRELKGYTKAHIADFYEFGYIPSDKYSYGAASSTIEYARDSACIANILDVKDPNQIKLRKASAAFEKIFDQSKKMIIPKDSKGEFIKDFNPMSGSYFNEGNSIQYTWANPDLIKFMIARYGESYVYARLLSDIDHAAKRDFVKKGGNTAAYYSMRYNHGNQVSQIMPFAFHLIGKHNESSRYVGAILDKFYSLDFKSGIGHGSDDDQGQLSAWYVLASLGVYDFYGGCEQRKGIFLIPPKFKKARIKLRSNYLEIVNLEKVNNKKFSVYVDGEKLLRPVVDFAELVNSRSIEYR